MPSRQDARPIAMSESPSHALTHDAVVLQLERAGFHLDYQSEHHQVFRHPESAQRIVLPLAAHDTTLALALKEAGVPTRAWQH